MSVQCPDCKAQNRDGALFCARCGKGITPGGSLPSPPAPAPSPGWPSPAPMPAPLLPPPPAVPRNTIVREELRSPGTVLHSAASSVPVLGWLVILRGRRRGRDFRIDKDVSVLGRDGTCDFVIEDETVSRQHVRIRIEGEKFVLFDLGSGNGTFVNGEQVQRVDLEDGDVIKVGDSLILFKEAKPRLPLDQVDARPPVSS